MSSVSDADARRRALDPTTSFIVQAPAGSGKTSLLTQRFLTLLAGVANPEEILAITFTKKAAGEMRERILAALQMARSQEQPTDDHLALTWRLASAALARNDQMGWELEQNPARLRVLTIDSLCARLAAGLPILSQFGASPQPSEDSSEQYRQAARYTLDAIHQPSDAHREAVATLLLHLDNDLLRITDQVADMLGRRDKWMRPLMRVFGDLREVGPEELRATLESGLREIIESHLERLRQALGPEMLRSVGELCRFAGGNLDPGNPFEPWQSYAGLPGCQAEHLPLWQGIQELLQSKKGQWRKTATRNIGLPTEKEARDPAQREEFKAAKQSFKALLAELSEEESVRELLADLSALPPWNYTDYQWEALQALLEVSRLAAAQLTLVFKDSARTDFSEVAHRAVRALGTEDEPTDLAMAMDSKLSHLLVDEFQDTSLGQLELLSKLTREWTPDEGRTLFLVGDPMQSIYRFRDAEVGLFLQVRSSGLGHINLEPLTLRSNFRSQSDLVEWFNHTFQQVFPGRDNPDIGSVSYSTAVAARPGLEPPCVGCHPVLDAEQPALAEAETVVRLVEETWAEDPERQIAILARTRTHLREILPLLKERGHRYSGVDLEPLATRPWVRDLLSITRALATPNDRLAWLSLLRAPFCGLSTADLFVIGSTSGWRTVPGCLEKWKELQELSEDGRLRLSRVWPVLKQALAERARRPMREAVEATWLGLAAAAALPSSTALEDCHTFLDLLQEVDEAGHPDPLTALDGKLGRLYAQPDVTADGRLQIMTIHKSKGLEFDTVILPGLSKPPRKTDEPLVSWLEWATPRGDSRLLLAPVTERGRDKDPVYTYVHSLEKKKEQNEATRLLYVAATRAKRKLHLVGTVTEDLKKDAGSLKAPPASSFLGLLWPAVADDFQRPFQPDFDQEPEQHATASPSNVLDFAALSARLREVEDEPQTEEVSQLQDCLPMLRLPLDWRQPEMPSDFEAHKAEVINEDDDRESPKFEWAGETVKHVGTVVHRVLQQVGREGLEHWPVERLSEMRGYLEGRLHSLGVPEEALEPAVERCLRALKESLTSKRGRWILNPEHQEARSEYAISGLWNNRLVRSVVDRTFIDDKGVRWVVDFKTGTHLGGSEDQFLQREVERYQPQLTRYARLLRHLDHRPVKVGLYFPLLKAWREWEVEDTASKPEQLEFQFE